MTNDDVNTALSKAYMKHLVTQTNAFPSFYKYCNYEGGEKMLSAMNIQFTRADSLNDDDEINISKCNIESVVQLLRKAGVSDETITSRFSDAQNFFRYCEKFQIF